MKFSAVIPVLAALGMASAEQYPTHTKAAPTPVPTPSCPAPGFKNNKGEYSCNPAHTYPNGELCVLKGGCYFLEGTGLVTPTPTHGRPHPTGPVTAGAAHQSALGGLVAVVGLMVAML